MSRPFTSQHYAAVAWYTVLGAGSLLCLGWLVTL